MMQYEFNLRNVMFSEIIDIDFWYVSESVWRCNVNNKLWCL